MASSATHGTVARRVSEAVAAVARHGPAYGLSQPASVEWRGRRCELPPPGESPPVAVDFSSVNVAKPLHAGHLRATVLGNFVVQINRAFGHRVVGINYLGDWGKQFAVLLAGLEKFGRPELLGCEADDGNDVIGNDASTLMPPAADAGKQSAEAATLAAVKHLREVYARASAGLPPGEVDAAHARLEAGDADATRVWRLARRHSLAELGASYRRLAVTFDRVEFESEYARQTPRLLGLLEERGLLETAPDGAKLMRLGVDDVAEASVVVQKRDGSSLYFGRDLLAAIDRADRLGCGRAHYVVDSAQRLHFQRLGRALTALGRPGLAEPAPWELHVQFGRVEGMSSRGRGSAAAAAEASGGPVLLRDILDAGRARMLERSRASPNHRPAADGDGDDCSDIGDRLAATVVAMEMMRVRRTHAVKFSWERDNSGVGAQYSHARLCSLAAKAAAAGLRASDATEAALASAESDGSHQLDLLAIRADGDSARLSAAADELAKQLLAFPAAALEAFLTYEPCLLVAYTNRLVSRTNAALRVLPVLSCASDSGAAGRLALFESARTVLASSMRLLGLVPMRRI